MAQETRESKWEGKASTQLRSTPAHKIWPLFEDFCSLDKWFPGVDTCRHVEGVAGKPGLVRYCAATVPLSTPPEDADDQTPTTFVKWCNEKLLSIDPDQRYLSYEITENNMGLTSYVAELKIIEIKDGGGCLIEWRFTVDPVEGGKLEDFSGYIESSLKGIAERMEKHLQDQPQINEVNDCVFNGIE